MNNDLQVVLNYHETTKHAQQRYARSLGYMDWSTQPNPFRNYEGAQTIELPLSFDNATPPYHLLTTELASAPLIKESLSQLLQFSMGLAAHKESGGSTWAVRCNASSGNLHPTETYLVLPPVMEEQNDKTTVFHYTPKNHGLEVLAEIETSFWGDLPKGSFLLGLSGITWREVWKYGERAFRYTNLDAGHAWQSIVVSAKMLGWKVTRLDTVSDATIDTIFGLGQDKRFYENEHADMLFVISPQAVNPSLELDSLVDNIPLVYQSLANHLSPAMQEWDIIPQIEKATAAAQVVQKPTPYQAQEKHPSQESKTIVLQRRSIHIMYKETSLISKGQFHALLASVSPSFDGKENSAHLCLMVHRVEDYDAGLYILVRNERDLEALKEQMHSDFLWTTTDAKNLYLLEKRDLTMTSKSISCSQDIASDGAFSLGMLCNFSEQLQNHGPHRYKELYWECGAIGQELYLEATSMGLSGTGIGCFLDDMMHGLLGIKDNRFQILYHFTLGRGNVDSRIMTKPAYTRK